MNKKKSKRREEKEGNNKKRSKSYTKKEKPKKVRAYGRTGIHFDPKILSKGSAKLRWAGRKAGDLIFHSFFGPVERKKPLTLAAQ
jgi:hypothetical protein